MPGRPSLLLSILLPLALTLAAAPGCRRSPEPAPPAETTGSAADEATGRVSPDSIQKRQVVPHDRDESAGICGQILAAPYRPLPREAGGNQFDPSGIAWVGGTVWLANDRECRESVPEAGGGLYDLDLDSGEVTAVPVPGYDDESRKFEALAWDGAELHAIGNVGNRKDNTFLFSVPLDPATGEIEGEARWHDLASGLGAVTGTGSKPWDHGLKIEGLASLGRGELLVGLRTMGGGKAVRAYRTTLSPPGSPPAPLELTPATPLDTVDLGIAVGGPDRSWRMARELSGLADHAGAPPRVLGVASAEFEQGDDWAFLSNALFVYDPEGGTARRLCTFEDGYKVESIQFVADRERSEAGAVVGTLLVLYDNDSMAPGGYRVVPDVVLPGSAD